MTPCRYAIALAVAGLLAGGHGAAGAAEVEARAEQSRYEAIESTPSGFVLNRDRGVLRGGSVAATQGLAGWTGRVELQSLHGALRYDGLTQLGLPLQTSTGLRLQRLQFSVAPSPWRAPGDVLLTPALALGELRIERAIAATPTSLPTTETMHSRFAALDGTARLPLGAVALSLGLRLQYALRQRLVVDTFGVYDGYSLQPQRKGSTLARLRGEWALAAGWTLAAEATQETLRFGSADGQLVTRGGQPVAVSSYPGSRQRLDGLALSLAAAF